MAAMDARALKYLLPLLAGAVKVVHGVHGAAQCPPQACIMEQGPADRCLKGELYDWGKEGGSHQDSMGDVVFLDSTGSVDGCEKETIGDWWKHKKCLPWMIDVENRVLIPMIFNSTTADLRQRDWTYNESMCVYSIMGCGWATNFGYALGTRWGGLHQGWRLVQLEDKLNDPENEYWVGVAESSSGEFVPRRHPGPRAGRIVSVNPFSLEVDGLVQTSSDPQWFDRQLCVYETGRNWYELILQKDRWRGGAVIVVLVGAAVAVVGFLFSKRRGYETRTIRGSYVEGFTTKSMAEC